MSNVACSVTTQGIQQAEYISLCSEPGVSAFQFSHDSPRGDYDGDVWLIEKEDTVFQSPEDAHAGDDDLFSSLIDPFFRFDDRRFDGGEYHHSLDVFQTSHEQEQLPNTKNEMPITMVSFIVKPKSNPKRRRP